MIDLRDTILDLVRPYDKVTLDNIYHRVVSRFMHDPMVEITEDAKEKIHYTLIDAGWGHSYYPDESGRRINCYRRQLSDNEAPPAADPASGGTAHKNRPQTAPEILAAAAQCISDRAATRDLPAERSMARTVAAFNALTGHALTERDGWLFMVALKAARATAGSHNADDYTDGAAYFALAGESAQTTDQQPEG